MSSVFQTVQWLKAHDNYLVLTHVRPDGDTIGCAAALCAALRKAGKQAAMLPNDGITRTYAEYAAPYLAPKDFAFDHVISVDIAAVGLFPENAKPFAERVDLCIDHHPSNEFYAKETCLQADKAACGEILYEICRELCELDVTVAEPLYVAVATDCGCFAYGNTTANTHLVASELCKFGDFYKFVNKKCFRTKSLVRMKLESMLIEGMEVYDGGTIGVVALTTEMMQKTHATEADAEDLASLVGQVEGVRFSVTLRELAHGRTKISLRTDQTLDACKACAMLGGGGHMAASGATVDMTVPQAKEAILAAIRTVRDEG